MKKLFTLIAVAVLAFAAQAATLTVADGTNYNGHYPFYGLYYDTQGTTSQVIYPAYMLTDMVGKEITKLEFYATEPIGVTGGNLEYALDVVEESEFATATPFELSGNAQFGHCVPVNGETMFVIDLEEPFMYEGGNLLLQTVVEEAGGYRSVYFYGENTGLYGAFYQYQGWYGVNAYTDAFLPKCTFTFEESTTPVEPPVEPVTVGAPVFQGYTIDGNWSRLYDSKYWRTRYQSQYGGVASAAYGDEYGYAPGRGTWFALNNTERYQKETSVRPNVKLTITDHREKYVF